MAIPERDTVYSNDGTNRTVYTRESNGTGWFVGIIVALALLAIGYLVFSANSGPAPSTTVDVNNTPAVVEPATPVAPMETAPAVEAPAPAVEAPAPAVEAPAAPADAAPATDAPVAPVTEPSV